MLALAQARRAIKSLLGRAQKVFFYYCAEPRLTKIERRNDVPPANALLSLSQRQPRISRHNELIEKHRD
jgi:hypothetical protein